jgi:fumarate reductase flavoprotein subunit
MPSTKNKSENMKAEVVVIGGGASGLAAAVSAAEAGAKNIIVLEKNKHPGGVGVNPNGFFAVDSPAQKRLGIKVSADQVYRDQIEFTAGKSNARLLRTFILTSKDIVCWVEGKGLKLNAVMGLSSGVPETFHKLTFGPDGRVGKPLMDVFVKECKEAGVQLLCDTAAKKIITNSQGKVTGVMAADKAHEFKISAKSVIIAAGGFAANREMLNKYLPVMAHKNVSAFVLPYMTGDGITMAEEAGAVIDSYFTTTLFSSFQPQGAGHVAAGGSLRLLSRQPEALIINKMGERYSDESAHLSINGYALSGQPEKIGYVLLDAKIVKDMVTKKEIRSGMEKDSGGNGSWLDEVDNSIRLAAEKGYVRVAKSLDCIADWIKAQPEILKATVERYNAFCDKGYDADFLKDKKYLLPLRTPPYYAMPWGIHCESTFGGIKINDHMEVYSRQDKMMPGLFAVGDNTSGLFASTYPTKYAGFAFGFALCSGYIAGRNAAKYVSTEG